MDKQSSANLPVEKTKQPASALNKVLLTIGLVVASPFIFFLLFFVVACLTAIAAMLFGTMHEFAPWLFVTLLAIGFVPSIKDRVTGRYNSKELQKRVETLEAELSEARKHIHELEEGIDFHRQLEQTNTKIARSNLPVNVALSVTTTEPEKNKS
jgi:hypothetical protein